MGKARDFTAEAYDNWVKLNKARLSPEPVRKRQTKGKSPQASKNGQEVLKPAKKRSKAAKRDQASQAYGVSVHPIMSDDNNARKIGTMYKVKPGSGVRVWCGSETDGTIYMVIYTPSNAAPTGEKN